MMWTWQKRPILLDAASWVSLDAELLRKQLNAFWRAARFYLQKHDLWFSLQSFNATTVGFQIFIGALGKRENMEWSLDVRAPIDDLYSEVIEGLACVASPLSKEPPLWLFADLLGEMTRAAPPIFVFRDGPWPSDDSRKDRTARWIADLGTPEARTLYELELLVDDPRGRTV